MAARGFRFPALRVLRRHRLIELFLAQTLDLPWDEVHEEAEHMLESTWAGRKLRGYRHMPPADRAQLEKHLESWGHPPAAVLLATVYLRQGDPEAARKRLQAVVDNIRGGPNYYFKKNRPALRQAERMLRRLRS